MLDVAAQDDRVVHEGDNGLDACGVPNGAASAEDGSGGWLCNVHPFLANVNGRLAMSGTKVHERGAVATHDEARVEAACLDAVTDAKQHVLGDVYVPGGKEVVKPSQDGKFRHPSARVDRKLGSKCSVRCDGRPYGGATPQRSWGQRRSSLNTVGLFVARLAHLRDRPLAPPNKSWLRNGETITNVWLQDI